MVDRQAKTLLLDRPTRIGMGVGLSRIWTLFCIVLIITVGVALRAWNLDGTPLLIDEAESSINALTILERGYPADTYLGIPVFENTLIKKWPGNPEYEFKDISYSDRGVAVYHAWLPLYAIASSFAMAGVKPDIQPGGNIYSISENRYRTRAARLPAVIFGGLFLAVLFAAGRIFFGKEAGWAALLIGTFADVAIETSQQARYYSLLILLSTVACALVWLMLNRGRTRDYVLGGVAFVLLFHTHLIAFTSACLMLFPVAVSVVRAPRTRLRSALAFVTIVATGTVPWLLATGFLQEPRLVPSSWALLKPFDLLRSPVPKAEMLLVTMFLAAVLGHRLIAKKFPAAAFRLGEARRPALFIVCWMVVSHFSTILLMPAASIFWDRLSFGYWGPLVVISAAAVSVPVSIIARRGATIATVAVVLILLLLRGWSPLDHLRNHEGEQKWQALSKAIGFVYALHPASNTKFYSAPGSGLILAFYTGLPFQSLAPIRRQFLDSYKGPVMIVRRHPGATWYMHDDPLDPDRLQKAAADSGQNISEDQARCFSNMLHSREFRKYLAQTVSGVIPRVGEVPAFAKQNYSESLRGRKTYQPSRKDIDIPMLRGYNVKTWDNWWEVFYYRFSGVEAHSGSNLNYLARIRNSIAVVIPDTDWTVYVSPPPAISLESEMLDICDSCRTKEARSNHHS